MSIKHYSISTIIIARNEEFTIRKVVLEAAKILPQIANRYEILINNDASTDRTTEILYKLSQEYPFIRTYHQKKALGITGGLEYLYKKVRCDLAVTNSGDGQCSFHDLPLMIIKINEGYDLVVGKRKKKFQHNLIRKLVSYCFNFLPRILFGANLYDAGSMKLYKREVLQKTTPQSKSVFSEAERIIRAYKLGYKVTSVKIRHFERKRGTSSTIKSRLIISSLFDMLKLRFSL